jgi:hypothetical protein
MTIPEATAEARDSSRGFGAVLSGLRRFEPLPPDWDPVPAQTDTVDDLAEALVDIPLRTRRSRSRVVVDPPRRYIVVGYIV